MGVVRLTAHLATPIVLRDELHLDGLLASAHPLCRQRPLDRGTPGSDLVNPPLPIAAATMRGATAWLATVAQVPQDARLAVDYAGKRRDGADVDALANAVHLGLGPGKNRLIRLPILVTRTLTWLALGQRKPIQRLAERLSAIGSWRSAGYGLVARWEASYVEVDPAHVLVVGGVAQRHLPAAWVEYGSSVPGAYRPPYWHPARQTATIIRAGERVALPPALLELVRALADPAATRAHRDRHRARAAERRATRDAAP